MDQRATAWHLRHVDAGVLACAFMEAGPPNGQAVILAHGFPYDVHAYGQVSTELAAQGRRVIVPYLRGYGPTRFLSADTVRSGQQGVLGTDLLALMDALGLQRPVLAGYDWGGRAACVIAALWPDRVRGLVTCGGYNIQNIAGSGKPLPPGMEYRLWYQYYFHSERGRAGLAQDRRAFCRLLWQLWSPTWQFDDMTFDRSAAAFDNPDFVDVVIHSYRHRFGLVPGDPAAEDVERRLAAQPAISVPTIVLDGADDGVAPPGGSAGHARHFTAFLEHRVVPNAGHNLPQEAPAAMVSAINDLLDA